MKPVIPGGLLAASLWITAAGAAWAHGEVACEPVPKAEWKPQMDLQRKLVAEGWKVRQVKTQGECYEVYGFNPQGERVEGFFHPATFEKIREIKP